MTDTFEPAKRSEIMGKVRTKDTRPEMRVRSLLHRRGFRFRLHRKDLPGKPDIVLPKYSTVVFVHGCFWHGHDCRRGRPPSTNVEFWSAKIRRNRDRDATVKRKLEDMGWTVWTIWECQLVDDVTKLLAFLEFGQDLKSNQLDLDGPLRPGKRGLDACGSDARNTRMNE